MKNILYTLFGVLLLTSCTTVEDEVTPTILEPVQYSIIGTKNTEFQVSYKHGDGDITVTTFDDAMLDIVTTSTSDVGVEIIALDGNCDVDVQITINYGINAPIYHNTSGECVTTYNW